MGGRRGRAMHPVVAIGRVEEKSTSGSLGVDRGQEDEVKSEKEARLLRLPTSAQLHRNESISCQRTVRTNRYGG